MSAPAAAPAERAGRNDPCPCGSGRKFKQCCGAAHPAAAAASPPRGARLDRLNLGPLSEASELREAAEALRQSMHGVPTPRLNAGNAADAGRAPPAANCVSGSGAACPRGSTRRAIWPRKQGMAWRGNISPYCAGSDRKRPVSPTRRRSSYSPRPHPPAAAAGAHHPLPPPSGRHLPLDVFHVFQPEDGFRLGQGRPRLCIDARRCRASGLPKSITRI